MQKQKKQLTKNKKKALATNIVILVITFLLLSAIVLAMYNVSLTLAKSLVTVGAIFVLLGSMAIYIYFTDNATMFNIRNMLSLCTMVLVSFALIMVLDNVASIVKIAPLALCALTVALVVSNHSGFISNFCVIMIYFVQSVVFGKDWELLQNSCYVLFAGLIVTIFAVFVMGKQYRRIVYITIGLILGVIASLCAVLTRFMFGTTIELSMFLIEVALAFCSGMFTVMLMFILLPIVERLYNVVSPFRFAEIATSNNALMQQLFETAPGTYNHSLIVANYCEACAGAIGVSPFLARTVAYYHDIGKMKSPKYFTENLATGENNPHDSLTPEASVAIIKGHAQYGLQLAKENKLPIEVQRAIVEHHGTMPIKFFYLKAKKYTDGDLPYDNYIYDGPRPTSKISAILMICDASEAALRSVGDATNAEELVDKIVAERMQFDQFSQCDITMREIDIIKSTIITTFLGIKHQRIKYPDVKLEDKN